MMARGGTNAPESVLHTCQCSPPFCAREMKQIFWRFLSSDSQRARAASDEAEGRDSNDEDDGRQLIKSPLLIITKPAIYEHHCCSAQLIQPASQHGIIARPANPPVVVLLRTTISYVPYVRKMENQGEIIRLTNQAGWQQYGVWEARDVSITRHQQTPCIWFNYLTFALAVLASPNTDLATPDSRCEFSSFSLYLMGGWLHSGRTLDSLYRLIQSGIIYKIKYE